LTAEELAQGMHGRILVAEDALDLQGLLRRILRSMNLDVETAENGSAACEKAVQSNAEGRPFDVILMDIQMPGMDGLEATRWLRSHGWKNPIVALTAHAMAGDREKCLAAGCDDYLAKAFQLQELRATVARHLRRTSSE
jgi:two-component system, sensor histidine kinase